MEVRQNTYGNPAGEAAFWEKVDATGDCWLWTASLRTYGYGQVWWDGTTVNAHRVAYELLMGRVAPDLHLDHLCRNPRCVNPDHLEPVTHRENLRRALHCPTTVNANKTACPRGHGYADRIKNGKRIGRVCPICQREAARRRYDRIRHTAA